MVVVDDDDNDDDDDDDMTMVTYPIQLIKLTGLRQNWTELI